MPIFGEDQVSFPKSWTSLEKIEFDPYGIGLRLDGDFYDNCRILSEKTRKGFPSFSAENNSISSSNPDKGHSSINTCLECGGALFCNNNEFVCKICGLVKEGEASVVCDDGKKHATGARLRIVGSRCSQFQPNLYKSLTEDKIQIQWKHIFDEYKFYNKQHVMGGGRAFPITALNVATDYYSAVQLHHVKRSQKKKSIMAACLWWACLKIGFMPGKVEVAEFMRLPRKGIASGDNFIRVLVADGNMGLDVYADQCTPEIKTLFNCLGLRGEVYSGLRRAAHTIVQIAIENGIGANSVLRTKVAGATFISLRRCTDHKLIISQPILTDFCRLARIRKNTVERFLQEVEEYHSYFIPCYKEHKLRLNPSLFSANET